jgi:hypothetical protein
MGSEVSSEESQNSGRRRHSRLRARLPARLKTLTDTYQGMLFDLSFIGARIAINADLRPGGETLLCWADFEVFANVAWCEDGFCGLEFDEPLSGQVLIATRDLFDARPRLDQTRIAARTFVNGGRI